MGTPLPTLDDLDEVRRLAKIWRLLGRLVLKCRSQRRVSGRDERWHTALLGEARVLYGRYRSVIGSAAIQQAGLTFDAFQHVLGQPSVYGIVNDQFDAYRWRQLWSAAESVLGQAIGRLEAQARRRRMLASPEVVARWARVINFLEGVRGVTRWLLSRPKFLTPLVERVEDSRLYRVVSIATTFGSLITFAVLGASVIGFLVNSLR